MVDDLLIRNVHEVARSTPRIAGRIDPARRVRLLADRQHGTVARWQLVLLRIPDHLVERWVRDEVLRVLHRGVYALGHAQLRAEGRCLAAVLAVGPGAVLSHLDAVALHDLRAAPQHARVHVTTTRRGARSARGLAVHTTRRLDPRDVTAIRGVPVTALARTLHDSAAVAGRSDVIRLVNRALQRGGVTDADLTMAAARARGRRGPGPRRFREARQEIARFGVRLTRSEAEDLVAEIHARHGLPQPAMNHRDAGWEIDAAYVALWLAIEIDSYEFHGDRWSFVGDRRKIRALQRAGWWVLPFAAADLLFDEERYVAEVRDALERAEQGRRPVPPARAA